MQYTDANQVPWYRQSTLHTVLLIIHLLTCGAAPLLLVTCLVLVTGDIYYNTPDHTGYLKKWSPANKVVAFILLLAPLVFFISMLVSIIFA